MKHQINHPFMSYEEIARHLGISVDRVREIEQRALRKLRRGLEKRGVTGAMVKQLCTR